MINRISLSRVLPSIYLKGRRFSVRMVCWIVSATIIYTVGISSMTLAEQPDSSVLSMEDTSRLGLKIEGAERMLVNIKIESEAWFEEKLLSGLWERTLNYFVSTTWLEGKLNGKARVDVHQEIKGLHDGNNPVFHREDCYSLGFDGRYGRVVTHRAITDKGEMPIKTGKLLSSTPEQLRSVTVRNFTGEAFSLNFFFKQEGYTFSQIFKWTAEPNSKAASSFEFSYEMFENVRCIKMGTRTESKGWQEIYWLDPSRGFALLGYKSTAIFEDGSERLIKFMKINKLEKVAENLWWPVDAYIEVGPKQKGGTPIRFVYHATNVVANDPNFDESVFTVPFPKGYLIEDKVRGITYRVGEDPNNP